MDMHPIRIRIREVITSLEERPLSFLGWALVVVGFSQIRGVIESITYLRNSTAWRIDNDVTDLAGFYLIAIIGFSVILSWLSRVPVIRITRLAAYAIPVIVLPPIIDLVITWDPEGFPIRYYVFKGFREMAIEYLTAYSNILTPNSKAAPGCLSVALVMVIGASLYVWMRTLSVWRTIAAFLLCHLVMYVIGAGPSVANLIMDTINESARPARGLKFHLKHLFTLLLVVLGAIWYGRLGRERWRDLRGRLFSASSLHYILMTLLGCAVSLAPAEWDLWTRVASNMGMVWIGCMAVVAMTPEDRRNVSFEEQAVLAWVVLNVLVSSESKLFLFPVTCILARKIAFGPPFGAGRLPGLGGLLSALGSICMLMWGFLIGRGRLETLPMTILGVILLFSILAQGLVRIALGQEGLLWPGRLIGRIPEDRRRWIALGLGSLAFPLAGLFVPFSIWLQAALVAAGGGVLFLLSRPRPRRWLAFGVYVLSLALAFSQIADQPKPEVQERPRDVPDQTSR